MTLAHVATVSNVRQELSEAEALEQELKEQVAAMEEEAAQAHSAGAAVLAALQNAMAPLMAELAVAQRDGLGDEENAEVGTCEEMESEIRHTRLDISHYNQKIQRLQVDDDRRAIELARLTREASDAVAALRYEQVRARHHDAGQRLGVDTLGESWAGLAPTGVGRRTMEVRAERRLREMAEVRAGRLSRDVMKLSSEAAVHQAHIADLSKRLTRTRSLVIDREQQLVEAAKARAKLEVKAKAKLQSAMQADRSVSAEDDPTQAVITEPELSVASLSAQRKPATCRSTGKLPQLSF